MIKDGHYYFDMALEFLERLEAGQALSEKQISDLYSWIDNAKYYYDQLEDDWQEDENLLEEYRNGNID